MDSIAIIGSSDLGQLICHYLHQSPAHKVVGFFDDTKSATESVLDRPILGKTEDILSMYADGAFSSLILGVGYNHLNFRERIFNSLAPHIPFSTYIHPSTIFDMSCSIGQGSVILPGCIFDRNVKIGVNVFMNIGCTISHDTKIGNHSFLGPRVTIAGICSIGEKNFLGAGTIVKDNIQTHPLTSTGAGAVLCKSTSLAGVYTGVPAKIRTN